VVRDLLHSEGGITVGELIFAWFPHVWVFTVPTRNRSCGNIFCGACTKARVSIPQVSEKKTVRVCGKCAPNFKSGPAAGEGGSSDSEGGDDATASSASLRRSVHGEWKTDSSTSHCVCGEAFSAARRRHHCRLLVFFPTDPGDPFHVFFSCAGCAVPWFATNARNRNGHLVALVRHGRPEGLPLVPNPPRPHGLRTVFVTSASTVVPQTCVRLLPTQVTSTKVLCAP
jgi:hypothetical protein